MFAAGNNSKEALVALMDAGGQQALSLQDNRGNNVLKYALEACEVKTLLETRWVHFFHYLLQTFTALDVQCPTSLILRDSRLQARFPVW